MAHITLNGRTFDLKPDPPKSGAFVQIAAVEHAADSPKAQARAMAKFHKLLMSLLRDEDHNAAEDCMWDMEVDEISDALSEALKTYRADPTSAGQQSSSVPSSGSPAGVPTSKVVSFSKGTVEVQPTPVSSTA